MVSDVAKTEGFILVAEDDPDDRLIIKAAFDAEGTSSTLHFVGDGEELTGYLKTSLNIDNQLTPSLLILDLNMPKKRRTQRTPGNPGGSESAALASRGTHHFQCKAGF